VGEKIDCQTKNVGEIDPVDEGRAGIREEGDVEEKNKRVK